MVVTLTSNVLAIAHLHLYSREVCSWSRHLRNMRKQQASFSSPTTRLSSSSSSSAPSAPYGPRRCVRAGSRMWRRARSCTCMPATAFSSKPSSIASCHQASTALLASARPRATGGAAATRRESSRRCASSSSDMRRVVQVEAVVRLVLQRGIILWREKCKFITNFVSWWKVLI